MTQLSKKYDLEERTAIFGQNVIKLCQSISRDAVLNPIISQLVRSATSVGANYCEANGASSRKDFANKIFICKKECQETRHWLRMLHSALPNLPVTFESIRLECQELILIFQRITSSLRKNAAKIETD